MSWCSVTKARQHVGVDVGIVDDDVGVREDLRGAHGDEARVTAACSYERDGPRSHVVFPYCAGAQVETPAPTIREGRFATTVTELSVGRKRVTSEPPWSGPVNM